MAMRRGLGQDGGWPAGYASETAAVARVGKRSFSVAREAQCDYSPGTPLVLAQGGKIVHAVALTYTYDGALTTVTVNADVDDSLIAVGREASKPYMYGCDLLSQGLYHFETPALFDSSSFGRSQGVTGFTPFGPAPAVLMSEPTPKFGAQCYQFNGAQAYYSGSGGAASGAVFSLATGLWCVEGWFYGQPSGNIFYRRNDWYSSNWSYAGLLFNAGKPRIVQADNTSGYFINLESTETCIPLDWNHVAWLRDSTGYQRVYVNGVCGGSNNYTGININNMVMFGATSPDGNYNQWVKGSFNGITDEMRITTGFCPYQGGHAFTPPSKPFGPDFA